MKSSKQERRAVDRFGKSSLFSRRLCQTSVVLSSVRKRNAEITLLAHSVRGEGGGVAIDRLYFVYIAFTGLSWRVGGFEAPRRA